jgi:response regulator RpfG family c-di-GMP phosphodiesterase
MILIVDDSEEIIALIRVVLSMDLEDEIVDFSDPILALSFFKENSQDISLVISDYEMPFMNGNELITEIKKFNPLVKAGIVSSCVEINKDPICEKIDFELQKPFDLKCFRDLIKYYV